MATGESPASERLVKKVKTSEPEHLVKLVKSCPGPLCGSTENTWSGYYDEKCLQPHYSCNSCKTEFAFGGVVLRIVSKKLTFTAAEQTAVREIAEEANTKASTAVRRMREEAEAKELMAEETFSRKILEEAKAKALTVSITILEESKAKASIVVRRMREEAAAEAFKEEETISNKILQEANAEAGIILRRMRLEAAAKALLEDQSAMRRMREEADAKASVVLRRMRQETCEEALECTLKPGNLTSEQKVANEFSSKSCGTGGGSSGIHFEPPAGDQGESAIEEPNKRSSLDLNLCP